ncbi:MAG: beta-ketoacyl-[acyl-carrier-protein] synthase family protein [Desulfobulbaceae bacterium]|jgi:3-oxoacyl-(acyl-carrier-protein) synthase|nr:beta-ketoacyl-[acyl-carrier-protein] synthase family protein [Desulfobulbaceae bacterium]
MAHSICVTGLGCCSSAGKNLHQSWINLCDNRCPPPHQPSFPTVHNAPVFSIHPSWSAPDVSQFAGQITTPLNPTTLFCLSAIRDALAMAGLSPESLPSKRVAIVLGTTVRCHFHNNDYYRNWKQGNVQDQGPMDCYLNDNLATMTQQILATHGPATVITNACASGTDAIGIGRNMLLADQCDIVIAGGADELSPLAYHGFASLLLCSESPCRPFDVNRGGLNLGEGAGIMILEHEESARKRGIRHCGWIRGYGAGSDGYHPTAPHPEARGLIRAVSTALKDGGITSADISFINGHGTGTRANDRAETIGLKTVHLDQCPLVSTKGVTGHTLGGAGGIEAVLTMQALQEGYSPGTIGCIEVDPELVVTPCNAEEGSTLAGSVGMSQSLAFGGGNSALIIEARVK